MRYIWLFLGEVGVVRISGVLGFYDKHFSIHDGRKAHFLAVFLYTNLPSFESPAILTAQASFRRRECRRGEGGNVPRK